MDFNQLNSVAAAEKGAKYHLRHPVTMKPLFDNPKDPTKDNGKPCIVEVMGAESSTVRAAVREIQKARAAAELDAEGNEKDVLLDDVHDRVVELLLPRVIGFENVHNGKQSATKDDASWFFNLNRMNGQIDEKSFAEQVSDFSNKRGNYLGNASAD